MLQLIQDEVEDEGLHDAEWKEQVDLDDFNVFLCYVFFGGVVEDDVIENGEDEIDVVVDFENVIFVL